MYLTFLLHCHSGNHVPCNSMRYGKILNLVWCTGFLLLWGPKEVSHELYCVLNYDINTWLPIGWGGNHSLWYHPSQSRKKKKKKIILQFWIFGRDRVGYQSQWWWWWVGGWVEVAATWSIFVFAPNPEYCSYNVCTWNLWYLLVTGVKILFLATRPIFSKIFKKVTLVVHFTIDHLLTWAILWKLGANHP